MSLRPGPQSNAMSAFAAEERTRATLEPRLEVSRFHRIRSYLFSVLCGFGFSLLLLGLIEGAFPEWSFLPLADSAFIERVRAKGKEVIGLENLFEIELPFELQAGSILAKEVSSKVQTEKTAGAVGKLAEETLQPLSKFGKANTLPTNSVGSITETEDHQPYYSEHVGQSSG